MNSKITYSLVYQYLEIKEAIATKLDNMEPTYSTSVEIISTGILQAHARKIPKKLIQNYCW